MSVSTFDHIDYDPSSPTFLRFNKDWGMRVKEGQVAGSIKPNRIELTVMKTSYSVARVVWTLHHGAIPDGFYVVTLDGNPHNLSIDNLYLMTRQQQRVYTSIAKGVGTSNFRLNKNGTIRVYFFERKQDEVNKEALGTFDTMDAAMEALRRRQLQVFLKENENKGE